MLRIVQGTCRRLLSKYEKVLCANLSNVQEEFNVRIYSFSSVLPIAFDHFHSSVRTKPFHNHLIEVVPYTAKQIVDLLRQALPGAAIKRAREIDGAARYDWIANI